MMAGMNGQSPRKRSKYADIPLPPSVREEAPDMAQDRGGRPRPVPRPNTGSGPYRAGNGREADASTPDSQAAPQGDGPVREGRPTIDEPGLEGRSGSRYARRTPSGGMRGTPADSRASSRVGSARASRLARPKRRSAATDRLSALHPFLGAGLVIACVFIALSLVDMGANWGKIYPGVTIGSVDVAGMTANEANDALQSAYNDQVYGGDIHIYADEETLERALNGEAIEDSQSSEEVSVEEAAKTRKSWTVSASSLQARLDVEDMIGDALRVGREDGGVFGRLAAQTFGYEVEPQVELNDAAVENLASEIDRAIGDPHSDYGITVDYGEATVVEGHDGREVDRDWLKDELEKRFLSGSGDRSFAATAQDAPVRINRDAAQATADSVNSAIREGATFEFNGTTWNASAHELGDLIDTRIEPDGDGWKLVPYYDESSSKNAIITHLQSNLTEQGIGVEFVKSDDAMMVRTNATGVMPEASQAVADLEERTLRQGAQESPTIQVQGTQIPSAMSVQAAMDYGIITTISEFTTEYTGGATNRNHNIHLAADLINNSVAKKDGGEWSFNATAGECNEEKGFRGAGAIVGGETVDEIGGGICQVATTVFNAVFEAGYPVDRRTNHSLYIASYPAGRDAAISWPDLDLVWHNDTNGDVLLTTSWDDTTVTVTLIGVDPGYEVSSETGEFKQGAAHGTRTVEDPDLPEGSSELRQSGQDGSEITVTRTVKDASGQIVRHDEFLSVYDAKDEITATGPGGA